MVESRRQSDEPGEGPDSGPAELLTRIEELEVQLRAQEHRTLPAWRNALEAFAEWRRVRAGKDADDEHKQSVRRASGWAVLRRLVNPATVGGAAFSLAGLAGVGLAYQANEKLEAQNHKLDAQNELVEAQNELVEAQNDFFRTQIRQEARQDFRARRAELVGIIYDEVECPEHLEEDELPVCFRASLRARTDAMVALVALERDVRDGDPDDWVGVSVDERTDLRGASVKEATLSSVDFHGVNLRRGDLRWVKFNGSDLGGADLSLAYLDNANLGGANLRGADLRSASLRDASLRDADLRDADLRGANLRRADLRGADLTGTDLRRAELNRVKLPEARYRVVPDDEYLGRSPGETAVSELPPGTRGVGPETPTDPEF